MINQTKVIRRNNELCIYPVSSSVSSSSSSSVSSSISYTVSTHVSYTVSSSVSSVCIYSPVYISYMRHPKL